MRKVLLITALICLLSANCFAQDNVLKAQDSCGSASVDGAEAYYSIGRFGECINTLKTCLNKKGFDYDQKIQAYRLLAMSYLAIDSTQQGDENITQLLLLKDNFEADNRDPERFRLQVLYARLQMRANLISSVSKKAERVELAPATVQIITAEDILNRGYQDIESIFYDLPGFDIARTYGLSYSTLYQRGYRSAAATERTLVLVDGVEDNELWTNTAFLSKQYSITNIKRVEIIYGPASTIYGANAFVGVINIVTKGENDYFPFDRNKGINNQGKLTISANAGSGSYNTRYGDVSIAARNNDVFFSLTGRVYKSDEFNLSKYSNWDGSLDTSTYRANFTQNYTAALASQYALADPAGQYYAVNGSKIIPTVKAILKADSIDNAVYSTNGKNIYSNPKNDVYLSSKIRIGDFRIGFQYWNRIEGSASDYVQSFASINSDYTNWQVRQYFVDVRYDKTISNHLSISSFSYFKGSDFGNSAKTTSFLSFYSKNLSFTDFLNNKSPSFAATYYSQQSEQFRTEFRANYVFNEKFDIISGVEFRNGILQGDYVKTSVTSPAIVNGVATDSLKGGNNYSNYTYSAFAQVNFQDKVRKINVNIGGRFDNNTLRYIQGYGTVFNPRVAVIYYPGKFVFKAIYGEAFLDASSFNKFSTSAARLLNNPTLQPERVKNYEVSAKYFLNKATNIEVSAYQAYYSNILGTAIVTLPSGATTGQFQALGKAQIRGIQIAAETKLRKNIALYANFTTTDPKNIFTAKDGSDSAVRTGDISNFTLNAGVNVKFWKDRLNLNVRANIVGDRPTGKLTSINTNPLNDIPGFNLFSGTVGMKLTKELIFQLSCNNIFNIEYLSPGIRAADGKQYAPSVPQPTRNFSVRLIANISR